MSDNQTDRLISGNVSNPINGWKGQVLGSSRWIKLATPLLVLNLLKCGELIIRFFGVSAHPLLLEGQHPCVRAFVSSPTPDFPPMFHCNGTPRIWWSHSSMRSSLMRKALCLVHLASSSDPSSYLRSEIHGLSRVLASSFLHIFLTAGPARYFSCGVFLIGYCSEATPHLRMIISHE